MRLTQYDWDVIAGAAAASKGTDWAFLEIAPLGAWKPGTMPAQWDLLVALAHEAQDRLDRKALPL